ncbi:MAG: trypsin-like peptidase domain-containing protein [Nocardioides sp.]|uniref:S1C family serine protease n=1 Tax=Nocardioides sp. TaxID=35761 RepID=UPI0039E2FE46
MARRFRHSLAAAALAIPLVAIPVVVPAAALAADDSTSPYAYSGGSGGSTSTLPYGYGSDSSGGYDMYGGSGSYGGYGDYGQYGDSSGSVDTETGQTDAEAASDSESTGVVMVNTVVDYGTAEAAGTGMVLTSDGIVVTNHHVVEGATKITVTVPDGDTYTAKVVGYDSTHDVAVLQLEDASGLSTIKTDTSTVTDGESITSVGNAEGEGSLTAADGEVTDTSTDITVSEDDGSTAKLSDLIEVDADIVSGDSGGALLDSDGEVIGMNVAASSGTANVTGYAIPISTVLDIATEILSGSNSSDITLGYGAALGVELSSSDTVQTSTDESSSSTEVAGVVDGGAAEKAGITAGDTITSIDGTEVSSYDDITAVLAKLSAGDKVTVTWTDTSGDSQSATVTLGEAPVG